MAHITTDGVDLYYEEHGSGEPIIFQHGHTGSHDTWREVIERLRDRYRCIAMDMRGAGDSGQPDGGYAIPQYAADVIAVADALELERFTFVGHSLSGGVGMWLGLEHAQRLDRLVLLAAIGADGYASDPAQREYARQLRREGNIERLVRERTATQARPERVDPERMRASVSRALSASEGHYEDSSEAMAQFRVGDRLGEIETPTLVVAGAADGLLGANLADFQRLGNASLHVFSRVAHGVAAEVPAAFSRVLADFMEHGVVNAETLAGRLEAVRAAGR